MHTTSNTARRGASAFRWQLYFGQGPWLLGTNAVKDLDHRITELEKQVDWLQRQLTTLNKNQRDDMARVEITLARLERRLEKLESSESAENSAP